VASGSSAVSLKYSIMVGSTHSVAVLTDDYYSLLDSSVLWESHESSSSHRSILKDPKHEFLLAHPPNDIDLSIQAVFAIEYRGSSGTTINVIIAFGLKSSCAGLCRRRGWIDPSYECYRRGSGFTCWVVVNGREYATDVEYESDGLAQENAAMRAFMICRSFSVNGGMLARNGVVQGLPARKDRSRHRR
jgi:hypothetical protein